MEDALKVCIETGETNTSEKYYVKGIITNITQISLEHGNATFYIDDSKDGGNTFEIYRANYLENEKFTAENQLAIGDTVVCYGYLINYKSNTPELAQGGYVYSHTPGITVAQEFLNDWYALRNDEGSICDNLNEPTKLEEMLQRYDALNPEDRAVVDAATEKDDTTLVKTTIEYLRGLLNNNKKDAGNEHNTTAGLLISLSENNKSVSLITLFAILGLVAISTYYFIEKKRIAK